MNLGQENLDFGKKLERMLWGRIPPKKYLEALLKDELLKDKIFTKSRDIYKSMLGNIEILMDDEKFFKELSNTLASEKVVEKIIKSNQPGGDPSNPRADFANSFHSYIFTTIYPIKNKETNKELLYYYTAIDTHMDYNRGTDFFLEKNHAQDNESKKIIQRLNVDFKLRKNDQNFSYTQEGKSGNFVTIFMQREDGVILDRLYGELRSINSAIIDTEFSSSMKAPKIRRKKK